MYVLFAVQVVEVVMLDATMISAALDEEAASAPRARVERAFFTAIVGLGFSAVRKRSAGGMSGRREKSRAAPGGKPQAGVKRPRSAC